MDAILLEYADLIKFHTVIELTYKSKYLFTFEPYLLFEAKNGCTYVHGWKVCGDYEGNPNPHFCSLNISMIEHIKALGTYKRPMRGYKPESNAFHYVYCFADKFGRKGA